jgi:Exostosin family
VDKYRELSPWREGLAPEDRWPPRPNLFFFATNADSSGWNVTGRPQLQPLRDAPGFLLRGRFYGADGMDAATGMSTSTFCWAPFGQIGGYTGRYIHAVLLGCIPVWFVPEGYGRALPFETTLGDAWAAASVTVHERDVHRLPEILSAFSAAQIAAMRTAMEALWQPMMFSTTSGPIWQEDGRRDAMVQLFHELARRHDNRFGTALKARIDETAPPTGVWWR